MGSVFSWWRLFAMADRNRHWKVLIWRRSDLIFRPPDDIRKILCSNLPDCQAASRQKYIRGLVMGWTRKSDSDIACLYANCYRGMRNLAREALWHAVSLTESRTILGTSMIAWSKLVEEKFRQWMWCVQTAQTTTMTAAVERRQWTSWIWWN